jgi:hypothetical protein
MTLSMISWIFLSASVISLKIHVLLHVSCL